MRVAVSPGRTSSLHAVGRQAHVDRQVGDLQVLAAVVRVDQVDRRGADDPLQVLAPAHEDALVDERPGVPPADRDDAQEPAVVHVGHHQADLVHVGGQHHARAVAVARGGQVAERVDLHPVDERRELGADDLPDPVLLARGPVGPGERGEEVQVHGRAA